MHLITTLFRARFSSLVIASLVCLMTAYSMQSFAQTDLRISPESLQLNLSKFTVLDTRSPEDYAQGHISGALNFPVDWTYANKKTDGKIVSPQAIQQILGRLGLNAQTPVVIYDNGQLVDAARLFWTLEAYGLTQVKVLDHGFDDWLHKNYPTDTLTPTPKPSNYIPNINHRRLATRFSTLLATKNPTQVIVDARPTEEYIGEKSAAKRFGHIIKAINIPASLNFQKDSEMLSLQPIAQLQTLYQTIPKDSKVILYCSIGRISAANYLALRELGYDVANYDASWKEWGNDDSLPIER